MISTLFTVPLKRYLLFLSVIVPTLTIKLDGNNYHIVISLFMSIMILFYNFPILPKILHMRPIYYEDLFDNTNIPELKNLSQERFQNIFIMVQMFVLALAFAVLFDYILSNIENAHLNFIETIGYIGGFITIYQKLSTLFGKFVLSILFWKKKKEIETQRRLSYNLSDLVCMEIGENEPFELEMQATNQYDTYHKYMLNNVNNPVILNKKDRVGNEILQLLINEARI